MRSTAAALPNPLGSLISSGLTSAGKDAMHRQTRPEVERLVADTRAVITASRGHIASLQRGLRADHSFMEAVRRDLADCYRALDEDRPWRGCPITG